MAYRILKNKPTFKPKKNLFNIGGPANSRASYADDALFGVSPLAGNPNLVGSRRVDLSNMKLDAGNTNFWQNAQMFDLSKGLSGNALAGLQNANQQQSMMNAFNLGKSGNISGQMSSGGGGFGGGWAGVAQTVGGIGMELADKVGQSEDFKRGLWDRADPVHYLAGGKESEAGNALGDAGVATFKASAQNGNWKGMLVGAGLKILGGLTNAAFGIKENKLRKLIADQSIGANSKFVSNAISFDDIKGPVSRTNTDIYEGGWFSGGKADDKNAAYAKDMANAYSWADRSVINNISNIANDQMSDSLRNYSAFGGPIDVDPSTAIGYSIYTDKFIKDKLKKDSGMANMFAGTPDIFSFGGGIHTKGANFDTGISYINTGGAHEENPNEGVQMGTDNLGIPNLVEQGEVRWDDYIFSDRLIVPRGKRGNYGKRVRKYAEGGKLVKGKGIDTPYESKVLKPYEGLTFADAAKKIVKRNGGEERDDAITMRGIDAELSVLAGIQEKEREKEKLREMQEAIDNMSPEEFAMLQQQMEVQQAALQQQEMAMQQLQMIPEGMELLRPLEEQQPIAALGGLLNSENEFKYGGSLEEFTKYLQNKGLTIKDYFDFLYKSGKLKEDEYEMALFSIEHGQEDISINEGNFDKDWAESYINSINSKEKEVARLYRKNGKDPKKLEGAALQKYQEDVLKATKNPELLISDTDKQLFVNKVGKGNNEVFSRAANDAITKEARQAYFGNPMVVGDNGKFVINYGRPEGVAEDWKPQSADIIKDALQFKDGTFVDSKGNVVDNPFEGYDITTPTRDWSTYGYLNPTDNTWTNVEYNPSTEASGNTDYRYTPWNEWFKDSKMDADAYEAQDAYLNNYLDFLDDIYAGNQDALQRLYRMGEASKSSKLPENMLDILGKNRYFNTDRGGFDSNNLTLDDIRVFNGNKVIGEDYITGIAPNQLSKYNDRQFYKDKNGIIHWDTEYNKLADTDKKAWTALPYKGLKREDLISQLKRLRNVTAGIGDDLLFASMFDNNPALSYLMANRAANRYALVDDTGAYIKDANGNVLYLNSNVADNPLYSIYNNGIPIETNTLGDTSINTIGVRGGNLNPHIAVVNGKYYNLTPEQALLFTLYKVDPEKAKSYTGFDTPITGYSVNPTYYEIPEEGLTAAGLGSLSSALGTKGNGDIENDLFPKAASWPYAVAAGLQLGSLGYNILNPADYSNADALIKAALNTGNYKPIEFRPIGDYLPYKPLDIWYEQNRLNANARATDRAIMNSGINQGARNAALLANAYNNQIASGNLFRLALEYNDALRKQVGEFNRGTNMFNSEGFLKADMANQDAATRAAGYSLEGQKAGYAMRLAIDDAKANAINVGLSGLANLAYNYGTNKDLIKLLEWLGKSGANGPMDMSKYGRKSAAHGGRIRRKKGLSF